MVSVVLMEGLVGNGLGGVSLTALLGAEVDSDNDKEDEDDGADDDTGNGATGEAGLLEGARASGGVTGAFPVVGVGGAQHAAGVVGARVLAHGGDAQVGGGAVAVVSARLDVLADAAGAGSGRLGVTSSEGAVGCAVHAGSGGGVGAGAARVDGGLSGAGCHAEVGLGAVAVGSASGREAADASGASAHLHVGGAREDSGRAGHGVVASGAYTHAV